mmetsp:Transcript_2030/g.3664  ORF Transcript_2030/g.3664 Transcript_2030/m.3664 type:complete len:620 (-) Transcript_2030:174-2033(-)
MTMRSLLKLALWTAIPCVRGLATDLYLGDFNIVVLTDVHGWVTGHGRHEPDRDADYGDVLSYYLQLKDIADDDEKDLFFVMNGDFMDGTGLSEHPPTALLPILEKMPFDLVNVGNHDIANSDTVKHIMAPGGFVQWWEGGYLTSNVVKAGTNTPLGSRYKMLYGQYSEATLLAFGFIYDFQGAPQDLLTVQPVVEAIESDWFTQVLDGTHGDYDAILVMAHMGIDDDLIQIILNKIRDEAGPRIPVQFITGHTHVRASETKDTHSSAYQAGQYLDTIGFVSFPEWDTVTAESDARSEFRHSFVNPNIEDMTDTLDVPNMSTSAGRDLSSFIKATEASMGILDYIGCAPITYRTEVATDDANSLWRLYLEQVIPSQIPGWDPAKDLFLAGTGSLRYDLFSGQVLKTDVLSVAPFREYIYKLRDDVPSNILTNVFKNMKGMDDWYHRGDSEFLPDYLLSGDIVDGNTYSLYTTEMYLNVVTETLESELYALTFEDVDSVTPVKVSGITSSDIWENFITKHWSVCPDGIDVIADGGGGGGSGGGTLGGGGGDTGNNAGVRGNTDEYPIGKGAAIGISITVLVIILGFSVYGIVLCRKKKKAPASMVQATQRDGVNVKIPAVI